MCEAAVAINVGETRGSLITHTTRSKLITSKATLEFACHVFGKPCGIFMAKLNNVSTYAGRDGTSTVVTPYVVRSTHK
jgi:hypothetical protein